MVICGAVEVVRGTGQEDLVSGIGGVVGGTGEVVSGITTEGIAVGFTTRHLVVLQKQCVTLLG